MSLLFRELDPRRYATLRIAFGLLAFLTLAGLFPEASFYYSDGGWLSLSAARQLADPREWSLLYWITSPWGVRLFFVAAMLASLAMAAGFLSRVSTWAVFVAIVSLHSRNWLNTYGGDTVLKLMLFYLGFAPTGSAWSVDAKLRRGPAPKAFYWPLLLMQAQIALLYFDTGWTKLHGASWLDGTAIGWVLLNPIFARADYGFIQTSAWAAFALKASAWAVVAWELSFPLLMLHRWSRLAALAFGAAVHLGILVLLQIHWFGLIMLASYMAFVPEGWFARLEAAVAAAAASGAAPSPAL